ncbi:MAG TPA: PAS domain S-box protein, partial [Caldilineaceae bacterium]|nr:PAS domain S-box protein [Caldilineaceae bacterium]
MATDGAQPPVLPYLTLFNAIDQGFCIIEVLFDDEGNAADYRFLEVNPAFKQQTGIENAVGRRMREIAPQHEAHWFELYGRIALTGEVASFEQRADQLGNRWYDGYAFRVGKPEERQVAIVFKDITNYKRAEEALQASEAQLRRELEDTKTLHELSKLFIKEENSESLYEQLLSAAVALMGADCASIQLLDEERQQLRLLAWKGFHPEAAAYWQTVALGSASVCSRAVRSGERLLVPDVRVSTILVGSDSHKYYQLSGIVAVQSTPLIAQSGRLVGMISTHWRKPHAPSERELRLLDVLARQAADMLERKQAEEALRQTQESLAVALEAAGMSIWDLDLHTLKARTNLRQNQNIDYTEPGTEWDLDLFRRLVIPQDQARAKAAFDQAMVSGEFDLEVRVYRLDGQVRWLHNQGHVHFNKAGIPIRMSGVTQDITERKQAEERLRTSDERFRRYFELGLIGMAISSPTKGMVEVNDELCRILGYTRSDLLQMTWADVTHPDDLAANVAQFNRVMAGEIDGYTLDKRYIRKDGQVIDTTLSVQCVRRSDGAVDY